MFISVHIENHLDQIFGDVKKSVILGDLVSDNEFNGFMEYFHSEWKVSGAKSSSIMKTFLQPVALILDFRCVPGLIFSP